MIHFNVEAHGRAIMKLAGGAIFSPANMTVISRTEDYKLYGGVVYENYTGLGGSCLVHIAGAHKRWINRDMLWVMFDYPFRQLGCKQAFAQVAAKNKESLDFCMAIGWHEVIRLEGVFPDDDMVLIRMRREECRYLDIEPRGLRSNKGDKSGKAEATSAARL